MQDVVGVFEKAQTSEPARFDISTLKAKYNTAKQALFNFNFATSHKVQLDGTGGVTLWRRKGRPRRANTLTIVMSGNWNISLSCKLRRQSLRKITPLKFSSLQRKESRRECRRKEKKNQAIRMEQVSTACTGHALINNYSTSARWI